MSDANPGLSGTIRVGVVGWTPPKEHSDRFPEEGSHLERYAAFFPAVEFRRESLGWIEANERQVIANDRKTLRRSFDRAKGKSASHMVHEHEDVPPFSFHYSSAMSAR